MVPGLLCDATVFAHQTAGLADIADIQIPSMYGFDSFVAMAKSVLDTAPARFALLGFSMGGRVALEVVRLAASQVSHLILMDTGVHPAAPGERAKRLEMIDLAHGRGMRSLADEWLPGMLHPQDPAGLRGKLTEMVCRATPEIHEGQLRAQMSRPDAGPVLRMITCPTLVICGRQDLWSPVAQHEVIAAAIAGADLEVIEDAGHFASMDQPEAFTRTLRSWLLQQGFGKGDRP